MTAPHMTAWRVWAALVGLTCICCAAPLSGSQPAFLRSGDLATHCALKGHVVLPGERRNHSVTLHVFMRLAPGSSNNTLRAAGYAMLYSSGSDYRNVLHLEQGDLVEHVPDGAFLRSPYTQQRYNLTMVRPREGFYIEVFALWGTWTLHEGDQPYNDFELRVDGFNWFCTVVPTPTPLSAQPTVLPALSRLWPPPPQPVVERSSLTSTTKVWLLLSTFHEKNPAAFAALLQYHYSWHKLIGVHGYILYIQGWMGKLLAEPIIQEFISKGLLHVVLFEDLGRFEWHALSPRYHDRYTHQILIDNHALLALWNTDSLLLAIDLDEFFMTPQPTTIVQLYAHTGGGVAGPGNVVVERIGLQCSESAPAACCIPGEPCVGRWLAKSPADVASGRTAHPLTCLERAATCPTVDFKLPKLIVDPNQIRATCIHWVSARLAGTEEKLVNQSAARVGHVVNMYRVRRPKREPGLGWKDGASNWQWPADQLQLAAYGLP